MSIPFGQFCRNDPNASLWDVNKVPKAELERNLEGLDWIEISRDFVRSRQPNECIIQWTCHDHPIINKDAWTPEETDQLMQLVKQSTPRRWPQLAEKLQTNRTAVQCFQRYQEIITTTNVVKRRWTPEEDMLLYEAVQTYGEKNWQQIAHVLETRTGQQCLHRWAKSINPIIRRGRWTPAEDRALIAAVEIFGPTQWRQVQLYVSSRTDVQCRERYMNTLNPDVNQGPWTPQEDRALIRVVQDIGLGKWSQVATRMDNRTDNLCWRRW
ncbi:Homeodomain-like protein, partial [Dimargaris cristalligena]